jgi:hypothetical protein
VRICKTPDPDYESSQDPENHRFVATDLCSSTTKYSVGTTSITDCRLAVPAHQIIDAAVVLSTSCLALSILIQLTLNASIISMPGATLMVSCHSLFDHRLSSIHIVAPGWPLTRIPFWRLFTLLCIRMVFMVVAGSVILSSD